MKIRIILFFAFFVYGMNAVALHAQKNVGKDAALSTLGTQGGALLYNTYVLIGAFHDGYIVDAWDKQLTIDILREQSGLMVTLSKSYDTLLASGYLLEEDSIFLVQMKECSGLLKNEADYLIDYINYESDENHDRYNNARIEAWDMIAEMLGLNQQAGIGVASREGTAGTK